MMGRVEIHAVVAPAAEARELRHRHQLEMRDPEIDQMVQAVDGCVERPLSRECADVQLVDHRVGQRWSLPSLIAPAKRAMIHEPRRSVHAERLRGRSRIRQRRATVKHEPVLDLRARLGERRPPPSAVVSHHRHTLAAPLHLHRARGRGPHLERARRFSVLTACAHGHPPQLDDC